MRTPLPRFTSLLFAVPLLIATTTPTFAQTTASASLAMTAIVFQPLSVSVTRGLDFGTLFVGGNKTVAPGSSTAGVIDIKGQSGANVTVTLTMPVMLMLGSTGVGLTTTAWTYATNAQTSLASAPSTSFTGGTPTTLSLALGSGSGTSHLLIGIGATASAGSGQTAGDYTGSGQVAVAYTDY